MITSVITRPFDFKNMALCAVLMISSYAWALNTNPLSASQLIPEEGFVFAGTCPNGEKYRLFLYQQTALGMTKSFYDYSGPAGHDTVQSDSQPKVMAVRVCRKMAEIIDANYWEKVSHDSSRN